MHIRKALAGGVLALLCACGSGTEQPPQSVVQAEPTAPPEAAVAHWRPTAAATWQLQLSGTIRTTYPATVYDIDMFDTSGETLALLRGAGKRVVCYFSAGSAEDWRIDHARFLPADLGAPLEGWPGERWVDTRSANVRNVMKARLDLAAQRGCDAVDPDNVDGHTHNTGFALSADHQRDYNRFLASEAHARGLAIGLKNTIDLLDVLEPYFDFAVNEQCFQYHECDGYRVFIASNKPVFNVEYAANFRDNAAGARDTLCASARAAGLRTLVLPLALDDSFRYPCD